MPKWLRPQLLVPAALLPVVIGLAGPATAQANYRISPVQRSAPSAPAATQTYGFNDNALFNPQVPRGAYLDKLHESGAAVLRSGINWQFYEPLYKQYNDSVWPQYDRNYHDLLDRGVRQIITLIGTPYWALTTAGRGARSPNGAFRCDGSLHACVAPPDIYNPLVRTEWQHFVREVVKRYPRAAAIEVWNEPNIQAFWLQQQDPALYAALLKATTQAVRQVSRTMPVLTGSTASFVGTTTPWNTSADEFLRDVYRKAGASSFNAIGWHFYPCNNGQSIPFQGSWVLSALRRVRDSFGDNDKPLWLTETGITSSGGPHSNCGRGPYTEQDQANLLGKILEWTRLQQRRHGDVPLTLVHTLMDPDSRHSLPLDSSNNPEAEYGLVAYHYDGTTGRTTMTLKPAYRVVRCAFTGSC